MATWKGELSRREFLGLMTASTVAPGFIAHAAKTDEDGGGMKYRTLGRTGVKVSLIGVGGSHIGGRPSEGEAIRIVRSAIDNGVTFMDNSWDYNDGISEIRMGKALKDGYRDRVFLMTKIDGRDRTTAENQLNESLKRLQTDRIDLLQFHEVIRMSDPDRIFAPKGALEAVRAAQRAGKVDSFQKNVLPVLVKQRIGVLGMKPMGSPFILNSSTVTPVECLHYAMNLPVSVVITGIDSMAVLKQDLDAVRAFRPMSDSQIRELLAKTEKAAQTGKYELYKSTQHFDSTVRNPEWLGPTAG